jgi:hypothetical protein
VPYLSDYSLTHLPTYTVRFNCSEYDKRRIGLDKRCRRLVTIVNRLLIEPLDDWDALRTNVIFCFYHTNGQKHIDAACAATDSLVVQRII